MAAAPAGAIPPGDAWLSDLPTEVLENVVRPDPAAGPEVWLQAVFDAATPFRFSAGGLEMLTDRRWWATATSSDAGAPTLVLRRWPGDTVLAIYLLGGATGRDALAGATWDAAGSRGTLSTATAEVPVEWVERDSGLDGVRVAALLAPGGGGLGEAVLDTRAAELRAVWSRLRVDPDGVASASVRRSGPLLAPALGGHEAGSDEREDPWRVFAGPGFTLGLPPGMAARRTDRGFPPPVPVPGGVAWLRGRFTDRDGVEVVVGDGRRAGYVAWFEGSPDRRPPVALGAGARALASTPFPLAAEWTGAESASVERWSEPGFAGEWLVFRLLADEGGVEIGLPVLAGRRSEALFWIPTSWRDADRPPAPPPIDPARRFGIRFERFSRAEQRNRPGVEGVLTVPGLRLEVPGTWWPIATLRSRDGFPVRFVASDGTVLGDLRPLDAPAYEKLRADEAGWSERERPRRHRAARVLDAVDGRVVFESAAGSAMLFTPEERSTAEGAEGRAWDRMIESVALSRPGR